MAAPSTRRRWKGQPRIVVSCAFKDCNMSLPVGHLFCLRHAREALQILDGHGVLRPMEDLAPVVTKRFFKTEPSDRSTDSEPAPPKT